MARSCWEREAPANLHRPLQRRKTPPNIQTENVLSSGKTEKKSFASLGGERIKIMKRRSLSLKKNRLYELTQKIKLGEGIGRKKRKGRGGTQVGHNV